MRTLLPLFGAALLAACGATIGDPCTTTAECDPGTCLNRDFTPGGACTLSCTVGRANACPAGTTCVAGALSGDAAGCMKSCIQQRDCRSGYLCRVENGSATAICVGPSGI